MNQEKKKEFIVNVIYILIWLVIAYFILKMVVPLLTPFILAFLLAFVLRKPIRRLEQKLHIHRKAASILLVALFYCTIGLLLTLLGIQLVATVKDLLVQLPDIYTRIIEPALEHMALQLESLDIKLDPQLSTALNDLFDQLLAAGGNLVSSISMSAVGAVSNAATSVPGVFLGFVLMIISSFFIAMDYDKIVGFAVRQLNQKHSLLLTEIKNYIVGTLFLCIRSYFIIMVITFFELSVGLSVLGIDNAVIIAMLIAIFDILPVLGTGGIMIPWTIIVFLQGNFSLALGLLVLYLLITVIRNIIEPKIVGASLGLHPVLTLISMFVGLRYFGFLGMFGFPILLSLLRNLNEKGVIHLYQ